MSDFNPITSTKTKRMYELPNGAFVYSHTAKNVAGSFIAVRGPYDWVAAETEEEAVKQAQNL